MLSQPEGYRQRTLTTFTVLRGLAGARGIKPSHRLPTSGCTPQISLEAAAHLPCGRAVLDRLFQKGLSWALAVDFTYEERAALRDWGGQHVKLLETWQEAWWPVL